MVATQGPKVAFADWEVLPTLADMNETCQICGCRVHRQGEYAKPSVKGRSRATKHHFAAERFFRRSKSRAGDLRERLLAVDPWGIEGKSVVFCYEWHEKLLHNPLLLPQDVKDLRILVRRRGLVENEKPEDRKKLEGRIKLLHEVLHRGIQELLRAAGG